MQSSNTAITLSEALFPRRGVLQNALVRDILLIMAFSWFVALCAQIRIPLTPVPITGQTLGVLLTGALLGSRRGGLSLLAYTLQGGMGLPFFAGGAAGFAIIVGPTGGYIVGFIVAAFVIGLLAERGWDRNIITMAMAMVVGNIIIYVFGLAWLAKFVPAERLLVAGLIPFIPGDIVKLVLAAVALPGAWKITKPTISQSSTETDNTIITNTETDIPTILDIATETDISTILNMTKAGNIDRIEVQGDIITAVTIDGKRFQSRKESASSILEILDRDGIKLGDNGVKVVVKEPNQFSR